MAPRSTRSKPAPPTESAIPAPSGPKLEPTEINPPHLFLLPKHASKDARFATLLNPATNTLERYFYCPKTGIYELKKISATSNGLSRSLLLSSKGQSSAYILKEGYILTASKIDPLFLLLPLFEASGAQAKAMARTEEDHFDTLAQTSPHMAALLRRQDFRALLRSRLVAVSELADAMGEEAYRLHTGRLSEELRRKLDRMIQPDAWAMSLEEQYVRKPLEPPVMLSRRLVMQNSTVEETVLQGSNTADTDANDATGKEDQDQLAITDELRCQARLRTSLDLLLCSYVPEALHASIREQLASLTRAKSDLEPLNFTKLDMHLSAVAALRAKNQALRSISDNISRKRTADDDDEAAEIRAEKRRKKEEEELKKKSESRAAKQLKKVDTSGMKKLSSFFGAKAKA